MIMSYVSLLILAGPLGIHSITTVSRVSVKAGDSISIPCLYGSQYTNHVKYLCYGYYWMTCSTEVTTETQSRKFSISDDKIQRIFTVTLKDLTNNDSGYYWCAVEIDKGPDVRNHFNLSVTKGVPSLYVDEQEIRAFDRGNVTVRCHYRSPAEATWCRLDGSCVTSQTGSINGTRVTINSSVPNVFAVTMYGLRKDSSGWYSCVKKNLQVPVHVTVQDLPSTTTTTTRPNTARPSPATTQHSSLRTSAEPFTAHPSNSTINTTDGGSLQEHKSSFLFILLLVGPAAFFGWRMMMRHNKTKPQGSNITVGSHIESDPNEHYATVVHTQHSAAQQQQKNSPEESVTYSTIVIKDSVQQMTEPVDGSVIYSTLHTKTE